MYIRIQYYIIYAATFGTQIVYIRPLNLAYRESQGDSQKTKIKKKTKTPRITDEEGNSQKQLSDPVEKKMKEEKKKEKTPVSSSKALSRFSFPIGLFYRIGTCTKWCIRFFMQMLS